jgi:4'-phosphopantetheinyl transferase
MWPPNDESSVRDSVDVLDENEVRVRLYNLAVSEPRFQELYSYLSEEECQKYGRNPSVTEGRRQMVARGLLREALAQIADENPNALRILVGQMGKPFLAPTNGNSENIEFNISHSRNVLAIAISRHRQVGIDIEKARDPVELDCERAAQIAFNDGELAEFMSLPTGLRRQSFYDGWVRKEAFSKAVGLGMTLPFNQFSITVDPRLPAEVKPPASERRRWILRDLDLGPDLHGAVAIGRGRLGDGEPEIRVLFNSNYSD